MKYLFNNKLSAVIAFLILSSQHLWAAEDAFGNINNEHYRVSEGRVDANTLIGYNVFHQVCVGCHGVGGSGTESVPDLTQSMEMLGPDLFRIKVLHKFAVKFSRNDWMNMEQAMFEEIRKQEKREQGDLPDMPRWEENPMVTNNVQNIYRYLRARSDGVIGPEKPGLLRE